VDLAIRVVGLVLRAPFFAVWVLWLGLVTVIDVLITAGWFFLVLPVLFCCIKVPVKFVAVAFRNHGGEHLRDEFGEDFESWQYQLGRFPERVTSRWPDAWTWYITAGQ
jgi:hypothetical protein